MDEATFNDRTRAMEARMYRIARSMLRCDADCADALQNAVFAAWRRLPALKDEQKFEQWLMRILVNACRDIQRIYHKRQSEVSDTGTQAVPASEPPDVSLWCALEKLPEKYRLPILLHHMDGRTLADTARILRLPLATVKWRVHTGLDTLRKLLAEDDV